MIEVLLLVPGEIIQELSKRFSLCAKNGSFGYYGHFTNSEFVVIVKTLFRDGYRVDIKPGEITTLAARKELQ